MKTIENASAKEIAEYLDYLYNTAYNKAVKEYCDGIEVWDNNIWKSLYGKVFSDEICQAICKKFPNFDWYDPDASYYRDVQSFIDAFRDYAENADNYGGEIFPSINVYFENKNN